MPLYEIRLQRRVIEYALVRVEAVSERSARHRVRRYLRDEPNTGVTGTTDEEPDWEGHDIRHRIKSVEEKKP